MAENNRNWRNGSWQSRQDWDSDLNRSHDQDDLHNETRGYHDNPYDSSYDQPIASGYSAQRRHTGDSARGRELENQGGYGNSYGSYGGDREYNQAYGRQSQYGRNSYGNYNDWQNTGGYGNRYRGGFDEERYHPNNYRSNWQREDWGRGNVDAGMGYLGWQGAAYGGYTGRDYGYGDSYGTGDYVHDRERFRTGNRYMNENRNYGNARGGNERDWWDRTRDEVSSWFGDEDAERRRDRDRRMDNSGGNRGRGPKDYQRSEDRIREDVCDRLTDDAWLDASNVQVQIQGNEVILSGTVTSREQKRRAEDLVESISGVRNVENRIRVGHPGESSTENRTGSINDNNWKE